MDKYLKIQKTIDFIEDNLLNDIHIEKISEGINFSVTHYYRIFHEIVGESIKEYIRKRRLSKAANELLTNKRVIDIAFKYGFGSQEAFTRAFYNLYNITPGRFRKNWKEFLLYERVDLQFRITDSSSESIDLEPRIIMRNEFQVIGLEGYTSLNDVLTECNLSKFMQEVFFPRAKEVKNKVGDYIISFERYGTKINNGVYQFACCEVNEIENLPKGMVSKRIPISKYAVFSYNGGDLKTLVRIADYACGTWLNNSVYEIGGDYIFDIHRSYAPRYELYIPVRRK